MSVYILALHKNCRHTVYTIYAIYVWWQNLEVFYSEWPIGKRQSWGFEALMGFFSFLLKRRQETAWPFDLTIPRHRQREWEAGFPCRILKNPFPSKLHMTDFNFNAASCAWHMLRIEEEAWKVGLEGLFSTGKVLHRRDDVEVIRTGWKCLSLSCF